MHLSISSSMVTIKSLLFTTLTSSLLKINNKCASPGFWNISHSNSYEEVKALLKDGYRIVSISYFVSNPVLSYILEKYIAFLLSSLYTEITGRHRNFIENEEYQMNTIKIGFDRNRDIIQTQLGAECNEVDILTLFPAEFMNEFTKHSSIVDFIQSSGLDMTDDKTWDLIQRGDLDSYVNKNSDFESWNDMIQTAFQRWTENQ